MSHHLTTVVRDTAFLMSLSTFIFAAIRVRVRTGSKRWALLALSGYSAAFCYGQVSLAGTPITPRTIAGFVAGLIGMVYVVVTWIELSKGDDDDDQTPAV